MISNRLLSVLLVLALMAGCGGGGSGGGAASGPAEPGTSPGTTTQGSTGTGGGTTTPTAGSGTTGDTSATQTNNTGGAGGATTGNGTAVGANNVMAITVNGSLCSANSYPNKPCVSVTVCSPGTSTCQTVKDILLDTGSYGLRIFKQALTVNLAPVASGTGSLAQCVHFGDGSQDWGPVLTADVVLGNEPAVQVPIQVIDAKFATPPTACSDADVTPADAGFNGILGVGLFAQDCGSACTRKSGNGIYYSCTGDSCTGTMVPLTSQVQNPVALLPQDNNGVIVQLPNVPLGGSSAVNGSLLLGIGTQPNNTPAAVVAYGADQYGEFTTTLKGTSYSSFIDSGSNGLFFTSPTSPFIPNCSSPNGDWFCPSATTTLSATTIGASGTSSGTVSFQIGNFNSMIRSLNSVYAELGGNMSGGFDWGLPFYFGRSVYVGIAGKGSSLGNGPYWAY